MSAPGQYMDPVAALAAQQQSPMPGPKGGQSMDPVMALAAGHVLPAPAQEAPKLRQLPQWAKDQGNVDPYDLGGAGTTMMQGPTFGFLDEMMGAGSSLEHNFLPLVTGKPTNFRKDYEDVTGAYRDAVSNYTAQHPRRAMASQILASIPTLGGAAVEQAATRAPGIIANLGRGAVTGGTYGGIAGFGSGEGGLKNRFVSAGEGAEAGAALGTALVPLGYAGSAAASKAAELLNGNRVSSTARKVGDFLVKSLQEDKVPPSTALDKLRADPTGQMVVADLGGDNSHIQRLARALVTLPGDASKDITGFLKNRATTQRGRVLNQIQQMSGDTDTYGLDAALTQQRSVESSPLYKKAFANPGVGPVDYEAARNDVISATAQKGQIAKQIKAIERNKAGALASRGAAGKGVRDEYMDLQDQLRQAEAGRQSAASRFEDVQAGVSAMESNQPLTDDRLASFMADPDIQAGMRQGLKIQRRLALARDEDFDPHAYAITGYDEAGTPKVGPVPTWRTLHAGREGLDAIIYAQEHGLTGALPSNKDINSLKELRAAYGSTLQRLNPDLKEADAAWSTPSQKKGAMALGGKFMRADPEQIGKALLGMNDETSPFYKVGAGRALADVANDTKDTRNIAARLYGDQTARDQIGAAFGDAASPFGRAMDAENAMQGTHNFVLSGSQTANKAADLFSPTLAKQALGDMVKGGIAGFMGGGPHGALVAGLGMPVANILSTKAGEALSKSALSNPAVAKELARLLMAPGPGGADKLESIIAPAAARTAAKSARAKALGRAISAGGPIAGITANSQSNSRP